MLHQFIVSKKKPESTLNINDLIEVIKYGYLKDHITAVRNAKDKKEKGELKVTTIPAVTLSGVFEELSSKGFKKHSGLMMRA